MRINGYLDYPDIQKFNNVQYRDEDGSVVKKSENIEKAGTQAVQALTPDTNDSEAGNAGENNRLLPKDRVLDIAVKKDMNVDKNLIGRNSGLENLDVQRAISDMKKDRVLMEYQTFVNNPGEEDGFVRRLG